MSTCKKFLLPTGAVKEQISTWEEVLVFNISSTHLQKNLNSPRRLAHKDVCSTRVVSVRGISVSYMTGVSLGTMAKIMIVIKTCFRESFVHFPFGSPQSAGVVIVIQVP